MLGLVTAVTLVLAATPTFLPAATAAPAALFTSASATQQADGSYLVSWTGAGGPVTVRLVSSPDGVDGPVVGSGGADGSVVVTGLAPAAPGVRRYFRLVSTGPGLVVSDRSLHLPNAKNARDVGGYRTTDGRWVRMGLAFRSGQPSGLTAQEWGSLTALGLNHMVDLRNGSERSEASYTPPAGVGYQVADVFALPPTKLPKLTSLLGTVRCANPLVALNAIRILATTSDFEDSFTGASYPLEACYFGALDAFGDLLTAIASGKTVMFHCSAGKDRTGVGAAILLSLLGVPRETVVQDFLLSNTYRGPGSVQREWIEGWFDAVKGTWGSMDAFARQGLGLSSGTIDRLKQRFLTTP